eukprot:c54262_g1_i1 orf=1-294(+)
MTPQQSYSSNKPSVEYFCVFGSECFVHVPDANRTKWEPKSRKCIFLGYNMQSKGYRLYDPEMKKVLESRDVVFNEASQQVEEHDPTTSHTHQPQPPD